MVGPVRKKGTHAMKRMILPLGAAMMLAALPVAAQSIPAIADADGSGDWSLAELQAAYPALTADDFAAVDTNGDGAVDHDELVAAMADGALPPASGG
jgi:glycine/D-amino acid oxidase-like deaminating enzyme